MKFFAYSVTTFQVATAIGAIALLVRKKYLWVTPIAVGTLGLLMAVRAGLLL
jgi:hypothetical protein